MKSIEPGMPLTRRESEVCGLMVLAKSDKEIARQLGISPRTVEDHKQNIYVKMEVRGAVGLVHKVLSARIAELEASNG